MDCCDAVVRFFADIACRNENLGEEREAEARSAFVDKLLSNRIAEDMSSGVLQRSRDGRGLFDPRRPAIGREVDCPTFDDDCTQGSSSPDESSSINSERVCTIYKQTMMLLKCEKKTQPGSSREKVTGEEWM